jgi:hypothetical protein
MYKTTFGRLILVLALLAVTTGMGDARTVHAGVRYVYEQNQSGLDFIGFHGNVRYSQTFVPSASHTVMSVRLRLKKSGNPQGSVAVTLRAVDENGTPSGADLAAGSIPCSAVGKSVAWYDCDMGPGYAVKAGTRYAISWSAPSADSASQLWTMVNQAGQYDSGWTLESDDAGLSWSDVGDRAWDAVFEEWGEGAPPPAITPASELNLVGYLSGWSMSRVRLKDIKIERLRYLLYHSVQVTGAADPTLRSGWGWDYVSQAITTGHSKGIKVLISLACSGPELSSIVNSDALRAALVANIRTMVVSYNADGIGIDWESGEPQAEMDRLVTDLSAALRPLDKLIFIAASWYRHDVSLAASKYVDLITLMTYDMNQPHPLPYHSLLDDSIAAMYLWADAGYPRSKLLMGIPFYGKDDDGNPATYANIVDFLKPGQGQDQASIDSIPAWDGLVNRVNGGVLWWGGPDLARKKVDFIKTQGFGGVMVFDVGQDKLNDPRSLLQTINDAMNRAPELDAIGNRTATEGVPLSFTVSGSDPDGDSLSYSASNLPSGAEFEASNRTFSWTPSYDQSGTYSQVRFEVTDGRLSTSEEIAVIVANVNRPPALKPISSRTAPRGSRLTFSISGTDPDGDPLAYSAANLPPGARFDASNHTFSWTPSADQSGAYTEIHFEVTDGVLSASEDITITVVNRVPLKNSAALWITAGVIVLLSAASAFAVLKRRRKAPGEAAQAGP